MKYKLDDLFLIIGGGTPKTSTNEYWNGSIPWISVADMSNSYRYIDTTSKSITQLGLQKSRTKLLKPGDVIISARGTVGVVNQIRLPMAFNQTCYGLRAKPDIVDQDFLFYLVKSTVPRLQQVVHGAVFNTITRDTFSLIEIDLPPIETQREIAHILGTLDDKIELNRKMSKTLEEIAQALYKHWFIDFEFPNAEGKPYKSSGGEMIDSELGPIPKGWRVGSLESICSVSKKMIDPKKQSSKHYQVYSIPAYDNAQTAQDMDAKDILSSKICVPNHCILISKLNPRIKRIWYIDNDASDKICSSEFIVLSSETHLPYLYHLLNSEQVYNSIAGSATGTSGSHQRINVQNMMEEQILIPDDFTKKSFNCIIASMLSTVSHSYNSDHTLSSIQNMLNNILIGVM